MKSVFRYTFLTLLVLTDFVLVYNYEDTWNLIQLSMRYPGWASLAILLGICILLPLASIGAFMYSLFSIYELNLGICELCNHRKRRHYMRQKGPDPNCSICSGSGSQLWYDDISMSDRTCSCVTHIMVCRDCYIAKKGSNPPVLL